MRVLFILICLFILTKSASSQLGGSHTYAFLNLTNSARVASLGGKVNAIWDDDLNLPFHNPSLLNEQMHNHLVLNYVNYFMDINYGYVSYAHTVDKIGNLSGGIHYINYGEFIAADQTGKKTGTFHASEFTLNLIWSKSLDSMFHVGVNVKPVYSSFEKYQSFGIALDAGITYTGRDQLFCAAIVLKNTGLQLKTYHDQNREPLPFEIQMGLSQKLRYAPFRFSVVFHNLQKFDLTYDPDHDDFSEIDPVTGEPVHENKLEQFAGKSFKHLIIGVEFTPFDNFYIRSGYNYLRRSYGRASYHLAGASNHFSLSTNLSSFYKRKL